MHDGQLDITQIRLLAALSRSVNLSGAARHIGVSPSAASHALAKLRKQLGEPLFTRTRSGLQPTPFGMRLCSASCEALNLLTASLSSNDQFDPLTSSRVFRFYLNDVAQTVFLPRLLRFLEKNAPAVAVRVVPIPIENPGAAMSSGEVDFAAGFFDNLTTGFLRSVVLRERHVCIVRSGHPRFRSGMSLGAFMDTAHVLADATGMGTTAIIDRLLSKHRVRRNVVLRVPHFHVLPVIVADSDLLAIVPQRLADAFAVRLPIKVFPIPITVPTFNICIHWHERYHHDPGIRWMRRAFVDLFSEERRR